MAVDIFLKLDKIDGESKDKAKEKQIDILSWSWGASQAGTFHSGGGGGSGKASFSDLSLMKYVDVSSHALLLACAAGTHIAEGTLTIRKAGDKPLEYLVIKLKKIIVTSVQFSGSGGGDDRMTESLSLNFAQIEFAYTEQDDKGAAKGAAKEFKWDIEKNAKM